jgi:hypothetical protein
MRVNAQAFFNFCAGHVPLLRRLSEQRGEWSQAEVMRVIQEHAAAHDELPETTWRRLREYQILMPSEPGGDFFLVAEPVSRLLDYLLNETNPATPEVIRGYVQSLETVARQLARALESENVTVVSLSFTEINQTLRRLYSNIEETHQAVLSEVGRYKTERDSVSVRDKFRRIVFWMERYVEPMIEIVRPDGSLRATFDHIEELLRNARRQSLFNDDPALDRNLRFLRLIAAHALRVFDQCRKEISPLYESLRRSSLIAKGAAGALEKLQNDGLTAWFQAPSATAAPGQAAVSDLSPLIGIYGLRYTNVPGDPAIALALSRVFEFSPEPQPVIDLAAEEGVPGEFVRRLWLDSLSGHVRPELPVDDLLAWLVRSFPEKNTADILAGFTELVFEQGCQAAFSNVPSRSYNTRDGALEAAPVRLSSAK